MRVESRLSFESPMRMLALTPLFTLSESAVTMGGSGSTAFTALYVYFCCSLNGMRMKLTWAPPSATCRRGSQKRP